MVIVWLAIDLVGWMEICFDNIYDFPSSNRHIVGVWLAAIIIIIISRFRIGFRNQLPVESLSPMMGTYYWLW